MSTDGLLGMMLYGAFLAAVSLLVFLSLDTLLVQEGGGIWNFGEPPPPVAHYHGNYSYLGYSGYSEHDYYDYSDGYYDQEGRGDGKGCDEAVAQRMKLWCHGPSHMRATFCLNGPGIA